MTKKSVADQFEQFYEVFESVLQGRRPPNELRSFLPKPKGPYVNYLAFAVQRHEAKMVELRAKKFSKSEEKS